MIYYLLWIIIIIFCDFSSIGVIFFQGIYATFYKCKSARDQGSLFQFRNKSKQKRRTRAWTILKLLHLLEESWNENFVLERTNFNYYYYYKLWLKGLALKQLWRNNHSTFLSSGIFFADSGMKTIVRIYFLDSSKSVLREFKLMHWVHFPFEKLATAD